MCIVYKPKGVKLKESYLINCFKKNPHGAGIMASVNGELIIKKGFFDVDIFLKAYMEFENDDVVCYFKYSTDAYNVNRNKTVANYQPFFCSSDKTVAFVHQGSLHGVCKYNDEFSEEYQFSNKISGLVNKYKDVVFHKTFKHLLSKRFNSVSKFVFLNSNGQVSIVNEAKGFKAHGCWFSNEEYKSNTASYYSTVPEDIKRQEHWDSRSGISLEEVAKKKPEFIVLPKPKSNQGTLNLIGFDNNNDLDYVSGIYSDKHDKPSDKPYTIKLGNDGNDSNAGAIVVDMHKQKKVNNWVCNFCNNVIDCLSGVHFAETKTHIFCQKCLKENFDELVSIDPQLIKDALSGVRK